MLIGYARVSTQDQDNAMQLDALAKLGCQLVYEEKGSGSTRKGRKELARCLASLRKGDTLCVYKIDRIREVFLTCWISCITLKRSVLLSRVSLNLWIPRIPWAFL